MKWNECVIAVVAGARREQEIGRQAALTGATVRAFGFLWADSGIDGVHRCTSAAETLRKTLFLVTRQSSREILRVVGEFERAFNKSTHSES